MATSNIKALISGELRKVWELVLNHRRVHSPMLAS